jgi:hypothetical protein
MRNNLLTKFCSVTHLGALVVGVWNGRNMFRNYMPCPLGFFTLLMKCDCKEKSMKAAVVSDIHYRNRYKTNWYFFTEVLQHFLETTLITCWRYKSLPIPRVECFFSFQFAAQVVGTT